MTELETIESIVRQADDPVVTVPEVTEHVDRSKPHVRSKMETLEYEGVLERKDVGAHATAWWHVDRVNGPPAPSDAEGDAQADDEPASSQDVPLIPMRDGQTVTAVPRGSGLAGVDADLPDVDVTPLTVDEAMDVVDVPGWGDETEARATALRATLERLRDAGEASRDQLVDPIIASDEFDTHYHSGEGWWTHCVAPALRALRDEYGAVDLDRKPPATWVWTGE